jgi:hypothetical protein
VKWLVLQFQKRRRLAVLVTLLLVIAPIYVVGSLRWHDPRLAGNWMLRWGNTPYQEGAVFERRAWVFNPDGTGSEGGHSSEGRIFGGAGFQWWTRGGRLYMQHGGSSSGWRWPGIRSLPFVVERWFGNRYGQPPLRQFEYVVLDENSLRIEVTTEHSEGDGVMHLTRIPHAQLP